MLYFFILIICIIFPEMSVTAAKEAIRLWYTSVLPVLLPFFIVSKMLCFKNGTRIFTSLLRPLMRFLGIDENASFPLAISLICGFPSGSRTVADIFDDKEYFGNLCFSSGPLFVIGSVGTVMLGSTALGRDLFIIHICTLIIFSVILKPKRQSIPKLKKANGSLSEAVISSIEAILSVCGYMIFFGLIIKLARIELLPAPFDGLLAGCIEFTSGIKLLSVYGDKYLPLISFLLSFGGVSVIVQCLSYLDGINRHKFVFNRILAGIFASLLTVGYLYCGVAFPIISASLSVLLKKAYCKTARKALY